MTDQLNALPKGSLILVTGANGYIGSNIVDCLLQLGFRVRGTVRTKKAWLDNMFHDKYGSQCFESAIVPSLDDETALDLAMEGVCGVVHVASDVSLQTDPGDVIGRVVKFVEVILAAANRHSSVKRFVFTSSSSAAVTPAVNQPGILVDENTWNDAAVNAAWDPSTPDTVKGFAVYGASKTEAERFAWKWVEQHKPGFSFSTILPAWTTGTVLHSEIPGSTNGLIRTLLFGDKQIFSVFVPHYYSDVKDVARLHAIALLAPGVENQRIFAFAGQITMTAVVEILRQLRPKNQLIPDPPVGEGRDLAEVTLAPKAERLLKQYFGQDSWVSLEDSLAAGIADN